MAQMTSLKNLACITAFKARYIQPLEFLSEQKVGKWAFYNGTSLLKNSG